MGAFAFEIGDLG